VSGTPPFNSGSFIANTDTTAATAGTVVPTGFSGGLQITTFEYYWKERIRSSGGGIRLRNSNGNVELSTMTDNPQWEIETANGINEVKDPRPAIAQYGSWTRFTVTFDWGAGTFDIDFETPSTGKQTTQTGFPLKNGVDIEQIELVNYSAGTFGSGVGDLIMSWDDIFFKQ